MFKPTRISWNYNETHTAIGPSGEPIEIGPGPVHALAWVNEADERCGLTGHDGTLLLFSVMLLDQDGTPWHHVTPCLIEHLWFKDGVISANVAGFRADAEATTTIDTRTSYTVTFDDSGETVRGHLKYTLASLSIMLLQHEALVRIRWLSDRTSALFDEGGGEIGFHRIPYAAILLKPCLNRSYTPYHTSPGPKQFVELARRTDTHAELSQLPPSAVKIGLKPH